MAVAALRSAVLLLLLPSTNTNSRSQTAPAPSLQLFLQAHHHLVVLFFPLNGSHATPIIGSGSGDRSESNRVMQLKREGPFNPSYVVPMPKSR